MIRITGGKEARLFRGWQIGLIVYVNVEITAVTMKLGMERKAVAWEPYIVFSK